MHPTFAYLPSLLSRYLISKFLQRSAHSPEKLRVILSCQIDNPRRIFRWRQMMLKHCSKRYRWSFEWFSKSSFMWRLFWIADRHDETSHTSFVANSKCTCEMLRWGLQDFSSLPTSRSAQRGKFQRHGQHSRSKSKHVSRGSFKQLLCNSTRWQASPTTVCRKRYLCNPTLGKVWPFTVSKRNTPTQWREGQKSKKCIAESRDSIPPSLAVHPPISYHASRGGRKQLLWAWPTTVSTSSNSAHSTVAGDTTTIFRRAWSSDQTELTPLKWGGLSAECTRDPLGTFLSHASISNGCMRRTLRVNFTFFPSTTSR